MLKPQNTWTGTDQSQLIAAWKGLEPAELFAASSLCFAE